MIIKVVTDSTADLPHHVAREMGITVVPVYLRFGDQVYRDRIDISEDEFYQRLLYDPVHPSTMQPTPKDFFEVYQKLSRGADGIISIHVSKKLSGTYNSALQGKEMLGDKFPIKVIDSEMTTMGLGQLAIVANTIADSGNNLERIVEEVKQVIPSIHLLGLLDTLKYLALGGRIGKMQALLGSVLNVKPLLSIKDGELVPAGRTRSRTKGIDRLFEFVRNAKDVQDLAIVFNTTPDEAQELANRINPFFPRESIRFSKLGPALGVHAGPGILFVSLRVRSGIE
jgi:DegV family protein with EDD domain